jgi:hypothetical protein
MAQLHDAMIDLEVEVRKMNDVIEMRTAQERIRTIRIFLDQMNWRLEKGVLDIRTSA